jgi:ribosomal protein L12E/L44/L45/RPP1/RPP2
MKYIAAYLLAYLGGNSCPSAEDLTSTLESGNFVCPFYLAVKC